MGIRVYTEHGEIIENVKSIITENQFDSATNHFEKIKRLSVLRGKYGEFIFSIYEKAKEFNRHSEELTQSDIARLIYLATYMQYDTGLLIDDNNDSLTKKQLQYKAMLPKQTYYELYNKLVNLNIFIEDKNKVYVNREYFMKGKIEVSEKDSYTRIFIKSIRHIYESTTSRQHKKLAVFFMIIPYVSFKYNIISFNPEEDRKEYVHPMTMVDICNAIGYTIKQASRLKKELTSFKLYNKESLIKFVTDDTSKVDKYQIVVNPRFAFSSDPQFTEVLEILFRVDE